MKSVYSEPHYQDILSFMEYELEKTRIAEGDTLELSAPSQHLRQNFQ